VGTPGAASSEAVGLEISDFVKTGRPIIPIDFDGALEKAKWFPSIVGLARTPEQTEALKLGNPGPAVLSRIEKSFNFSRRNRRVRRTFLTATVLLLALVAASVYFGRDAVRQGRDAAEKKQALQEEDKQLATSRDQTQKALDEAEAKTAEAESRGLAATAVSQLSVDPEVSVAVAQKAYSKAPTTEAENALRQALFESHAYLTIQNHKGRISNAAFSPDGRLVVVASGASANVLDLATGEVVRELRGHSGPVLGAAFNGKGDLIVTAGSDETARIWNWQTGRTLLRLVGHTAPLTTAQFDPTGTFVVTTTEDNPAPHCRANVIQSARRIFPSEDYTARIWTVKTGALAAPVLTGTCLSSARVGPGTPFKPFSPDGRFVAFASKEGEAPRSARVWDVTTARAYESENFGWFDDAVFSPDGKLMAATSAGTTVFTRGSEVTVWNLDTGAEIAHLNGLTGTGSLNAMAFSPDSKQFATANEDYKVRLWTMPERESGEQNRKLSPRLELFGHLGAIRSIAFDPDGDFLLTGSDDDTARVWEVATGKQVAVLRGHTSSVRNAVFSPNGQFMITTSDDQTARIWTAAMGQPLTHVPEIFARVEGAQFSSAADRVLIRDTKNVVHIWNADSNAAAPGDLAGRVAAISPDGKSVVTASSEGAAVIYDLSTGRPRYALNSESDPINFAAFSPDGRQVFAVSDGGVAQLWDARTGRKQRTFKSTAARTRTAVFGIDGSHLLAIGNGTTQLWDLTQETPPLEIGTRSPVAAVVSPGGKLVLSIEGRIAEVWDASTGFQLAKLEPDAGKRQIVAVAFSPDGKLIVTATAYFATVWKVPEKWDDQSSGTTMGNELVSNILGALFSPDSRLVVTLYSNSTLKPGAVVWKADTGKQVGQISGQISDAAFTHENKLATVSQDGTVRIWDPRTGNRERELQGYLGPLKHVAISSDDQLVLAQADEPSNAFLVWRLKDGKQMRLRGQRAAFSPDGKSVLAVSGGDRVRVQNVSAGTTGLELRGPVSEITYLRFSEDGRSIVGLSSDRMVWVWDAVTARVLASRRMDATTQAAVFSPNGNLIAIDTGRNRFHLWTWKASQELLEVPGGPGTLNSGMFSPDSKNIVSRRDQVAEVWRLPEDQGIRPTKVKELRGRHTDKVNSASFSSDGEFVVTASDDATALIWKWKTNYSPVELRGHAGQVFGATFSHDGKYVVTPSRDATARVWESETGKSVTELFGHQGPVREAGFSSDGQFILTVGDDHKARIFGCVVCADVATLVGRAAARRALPSEQLGRYIH
jgi:WD40 repeat protein